MKNQSLIINHNDTLYDILEEISDELNFSITKFLKKDFTTIKLTKDLNYLFLTNKEISPSLVTVTFGVLSSKIFHVSKLSVGCGRTTI